MVVGLLQWWYTGGWKVFVSGLGQRLKGTADFFSVGILLKTLFAPFRQISSNSGGSALQRFGDRLFSRIIGAIVRTGIIIAGIVTLVVQAAFGVVLAVIWPVVPLFPIICVVLTIVGVTF